MAERTYIAYNEFPTSYKDISYEPDNMDYDENPFTWEDFCRETLGNLTYADVLCARAEWAYPCTMIDEDMREGAVVFDKETGTLVIADEDTGEELDACYDPNFFDRDSYFGN